MKNLMKTFLIAVLFISSLHFAHGQESSLSNIKVENEEISKFLGEWTGTLTYLDYSTGKPYSMPCDASIEELKANKKLALSYKYSNEPKANSKGRISIAKNGTLINNKRITSKSINNDGQVEIIAEYFGSDGNDNKRALIRNVYSVGDRNLTIRKEVKFKGKKDWIVRNEYNFSRK